MNKYYNINVIDVGVNKEDEELVKMFNPTLKMSETNLFFFFLIVVINGLT